jgi:hypothetical protein
MNDSPGTALVCCSPVVTEAKCMHRNELPEERVPHKLDAGEGKRFAFGSQLATRIATPSQLGQAASGTVLTGARGAKFPVHRHGATHEALFVL